MQRVTPSWSKVHRPEPGADSSGRVSAPGPAHRRCLPGGWDSNRAARRRAIAPITIDDFVKPDLRIAKIVKAERVEGSANCCA